MIDLAVQRYALFALLAAALFGASTPLAKLLVGTMPVLMLAALLYLGSGVGLLAIHMLRRILPGAGAALAREAPLSRRDYPWLAGAVLTGGIAAPILLLWGLRDTEASSAALLLNLEGVLTTLVAALLFREAVGGRVWLCALLMLAAGLLLAYDPLVPIGLSPQALAVAGACFLWALDNNLTRRIAASDPMQIAMIKGLAAGGAALSLSFASGAALPAEPALAGAMLLGLFSYGISLVLFVYALRHLGSARASAQFSTAPFLGSGLSVLMLREAPSAGFLTALALMLLATYLVLSERHEHEHIHEPLVHSHLHCHDVHHQHVHDGSEGPEPHNHPHCHEPLTHSHPHLPDLHHRHKH